MFSSKVTKTIYTYFGFTILLFFLPYPNFKFKYLEFDLSIYDMMI